MRCKRSPNITNYQTDAALACDVKIPQQTSAVLLRCRTPVGAQISLGGPYGIPSSFFSLGAGETYSEENMTLDGDLVLHVVAASAATFEVWTWDG